MALDEPIVILGMPRSGSSMTAGLFHIHGCWTGNCIAPQSVNPKGFFENQDVKAILIRRFGKLAQTTKPALPQPGFKQEVLRLKPTSPWMVKHSAMYRRAWHEFRPKFVNVRRDVDGIIGSNRRVNFLGTQNEMKMRAIISAHFNEMDQAPNAVNVYTDALIEGDYRSIEEALRFCGLEPDREKIASFIDPGLWESWRRS